MIISIIGQGYVGLPIAISAAEAGHMVNGFDIDTGKVERLTRGISESPEVTSEKILRLQSNGNIKFSSDKENLSDSSIFILAVPTPLDESHKPDLTFLISACQIISKVVKPGALIINESTSYIGTLRNLIKPTIDKLSNINNLEYAVAPERIDPGNKNWNIKNTPRVIGGMTPKAVERAVDFYSSFCDHINCVSKPEVAEAAKLFENTFRQVNIALVNEFSDISSHFDFSANEALIAASTKPFGFMPFYPGIGVGGHCIPIDPSYLTYSAKEVDTDAPLVNIANKINFSNPIKIAKRIKVKLGGNLVDKEIQIAGITYKPNISDLRESPALTLIKELKNLGAKVSWFDPFVKVYDGEESQPLKSSVDLGLIVTPHDVIDFSIWKTFNINVLDLSSTSKNYGWPKFL